MSQDSQGEKSENHIFLVTVSCCVSQSHVTVTCVMSPFSISILSFSLVILSKFIPCGLLTLVTTCHSCICLAHRHDHATVVRFKMLRTSPTM